MRLVTERLVLRELTLADAPILRAGINDKDISGFLLVVPHPYTKRHAEEFITRAQAAAKKKPRKNYELAIQSKESKELLGVIGISSVDANQGTATIGYWLAKQHWRRGYMTEALAAAIDFLFLKLKLRRIDIGAFTENEASNGLIRKMGFTHEGILRKKRRSKATGKIHDEHVYGLLREEWLARKRN
jgi:RimJ/RimL family protein N-acetyltransferase